MATVSSGLHARLLIVGIGQECLHSDFFPAGSIWNTIAFVKPTYITFPTFKPGSTADISFHFKTYRDHGVFLENSDDQLRNFIRIELNSESARVWIIFDKAKLTDFSPTFSPLPFSHPQSCFYIHGW